MAPTYERAQELLLRGDRLGGGGRRKPPVLPLVMDAQEFGLSPEKLLPFLERDLRTSGLVRPRPSSNSPGRVGYWNPPIGAVFGKRLAVRIGSLLSRPWCTFANSFLWTSGRGARQGAHLDRPGLDVTMSIPLSLDGADRWPLWVEQPGGSRFEWAGAPGTILILDGRHRMHGRDAFEGRRSVVLLLHWTAPAVLWPGFLDQDARSRLTAAAGKIERGALAGGALLDRCLELAQSAVAWSVEPEAVVCGDRTQARREIAACGRGASFLALIDGQAELTIDELGAVALQPGDSLAFPPKTNVEIRWIGTGGGKAIVGRSMLAKRNSLS